MRHRKAGFNHLAVDLIKEAQLHSIGGVAPDGEVGSTVGDGRAKGSGIGWKHAVILP
jgi:hypothetical protein